MLYQVIEAGRVFEIEAPGCCRIEQAHDGRSVLMVPAVDAEAVERLEPHAIVRAAKDRLLGLSCSRCWRIDESSTTHDPAMPIREIKACV